MSSNLSSTHIIREEIYDGAVVAYHLLGVSTEWLDKWARDIADTLRRWPDGVPCRLIYDLSEPGVVMPYLVFTGRKMLNIGITEYGRSQVGRILQNRPDLVIYLAVLTGDSTTGATAKRFSRDGEENPNFKHSYFFDLDDALQWLVSLE